MSILGGKSETLTFSGTQNKFGLFWGSIDSYNSVAFYSGNSATPFLTLFGNNLNAVPALGFNGDQSGALTNAYVTFTGLSFDKIVLASTTNSFEFDNISYGNVGPVPEPSTWAMLLLGSPVLASSIVAADPGLPSPQPELWLPGLASISASHSRAV